MKVQTSACNYLIIIMLLYTRQRKIYNQCRKCKMHTLTIQCHVCKVI